MSPSTSIISQNTSNQNFYRAILLGISEMSGNYVFEDNKSHQPSEQGLYIVPRGHGGFLYKVWSYKLQRWLIGMVVRRSIVLFKSQSDQRAATLTPLHERHIVSSIHV
jgi:hypothetical protein